MSPGSWSLQRRALDSMTSGKDSVQSMGKRFRQCSCPSFSWRFASIIAACVLLWTTGRFWISSRSHQFYIVAFLSILNPIYYETAPDILITNSRTRSKTWSSLLSNRFGLHRHLYQPIFSPGTLWPQKFIVSFTNTQSFSSLFALVSTKKAKSMREWSLPHPINPGDA